MLIPEIEIKIIGVIIGANIKRRILIFSFQILGEIESRTRRDQRARGLPSHGGPAIPMKVTRVGEGRSEFQHDSLAKG